MYIFFNSVYLDKKFVYLCDNSLRSKTALENVLFVYGGYNQFTPPSPFLPLIYQAD